MNKGLYPNALAQLTAWFVVDNQGCILEVNEKLRQLTQYPASELMNQHLSCIQLEPVTQQFLAIVGTMALRQIWHGEFKIKNKTGDFNG